MVFRVSGRIDLDGKQAKAEAAATEGALTKLKNSASRGWDGVKGGLGKVKEGLVGAKNAVAGFNMRGVSQQLSQVGQMGAVTGNYLQALAVQLPDLGLMFGVAGAAIGTVAGIALPTLIAALGGTVDAGKAVRDSLDDLTNTSAAYVDAAQAMSLSTADLKDKYGSLAGVARGAISAIADVRLAEAIGSTTAAIAALTATLDDYAMTSQRLAGLQVYDFEALAEDLAISQGAAMELASAMGALGRASTLREQAEAASALVAQLDAAYGSALDMPLPLRDAYLAAAQIVDQAGKIQGATEEATFSIWDFVDGAAAAGDQLGAAVGQAQSLAVAAGDAAANVWAAINGMAQARVSQGKAVGGGRGIGPQGVVGGAVSASDPNGFWRQIQDQKNWKPPVRPGSRGGGGGGAAKAEADAVGELIAKLQEELAIAREADPVKQAMIGYREELADATDAERKQVEELTAAIEAEKAASESAQDAMDFFGDAGGNVLMGLAKGGEEAKNAMENLKAAILDAALQALIMGEGPLAGLFGGALGFDAGTSIMDGIGSLFGFAEGGRIAGPGTGTSDSILARVSDGEFVVNAAATSKNLPLLEAINSGSLPAFAQGGIVGGGSGGGAFSFGGRGSSPDIHIHVNGARGNSEIREMVQQGVRQGLQTYDREVLPGRVMDIGRGNGRTG